MTTESTDQEIKAPSWTVRFLPAGYTKFAACAFLLFFLLAVLFARKGMFLPLVFLLPLGLWIDFSSLQRVIKTPMGLALGGLWLLLLANALMLNGEAASKVLELALLWGVAFFFASYVRLQEKGFAQFLIWGFISCYGVALVFIFLQNLTDFFVLRNLLGWDTEKITGDFGATMAPMAVFSFLFFAALVLKQKTLWALGGALMLLICLLLSPFSSALIAFVLGVLSFCLIYLWRKGGFILIQGGVALFLLLIPFLMVQAPSANSLLEAGTPLPDSWGHRIEIWRYSSERAMEAPLLGHGFKSSRNFKDLVDVRGMKLAAIPLHPHNAALQIWLELGLVGVLAFLGVWAFLSRAIWQWGMRLNRSAFAVVMATMVSLVVISFLSFGFWQTSWQGVIIISVVFLALYEDMLRLFTHH